MMIRAAGSDGWCALAGRCREQRPIQRTTRQPWLQLLMPGLWLVVEAQQVVQENSSIRPGGTGTAAE